MSNRDPFVTFASITRETPRETADTAIHVSLSKRRRAAYDLYHERYDNNLYVAATRGKSVLYANQVIDAAMALCGHPDYTFPCYRTFCTETLEFLAAFVS
jgi:hypothetical protein